MANYVDSQRRHLSPLPTRCEECGGPFERMCEPQVVKGRSLCLACTRDAHDREKGATP